MYKKDINFLLKQVRVDTGFKQKDARKGVMSDVSYSKMENGKKSVSFDEIILILDNLQVSLEEFLTMYVQPILSESTRVKLFNYYNQLPSEEALESIFLMFEDLSERYPDISSDELGVYFDIKAIFHREYSDKIPPILHSEQQYVIKRLKNKAKHKLFLTDYKIVAQTINDLSVEEMKEVIDVVFPIASDTYLPIRSRQHISNIFMNSITPMLKEKEYVWVSELLNIAEDHKFIFQDSYYYLAQFSYLKNIFLFFSEKDMLGLQKAYAIIEAIELIGESDTASAMRKELQELLEGEGRKSFSMQDINVGKV